MPSTPSLQVKEVAEWDAQSGLDLLFLGDSIMESWRGTFMGMSWSPFSNVPALFKTAFGAYDAAALAIAGQSQTVTGVRSQGPGCCMGQNQDAVMAGGSMPK